MLTAALFALAIVLAIGLFVILHLRPLREHEVMVLAGHRRTKAVNSYFTFDEREYSVNADFKSSMPVDGGFKNISEKFCEFPAIAAGLLKYKKHEWIIIAFERNKSVDLMWMIKGPDSSRVHCGISPHIIRSLAVKGACRSVLVFHNHPNPAPSTYSLRDASDQDRETADELACQLRDLGVNLLAFVCERGSHYEYWRSVCDSFFPIGTFAEEIVQVNGRSRLQNLSLHCERLFG
jgi:hypothetical protein